MADGPARVPSPARRLARALLGGAGLALAACVALDAGGPASAPAPAPVPGPEIGRLRPPPPRPPEPPPAPAPRPRLPQAEGRIRAVPAEVDFASVELGRSVGTGITLENAGWGPLRIRGVSLGDSRAFAVADEGCSGRTLRSHEECRVEVRFGPREPGRISGILRVTSDDPSRPHLDVRLAGAGVAPRRGGLTLRPPRLDFGAVEAGRDRILEVEVANTGGAPLGIGATAVSGRGFRVVSDLCSRAELAPGRACRVAVSFAPPSAGEFPGELRVRPGGRDGRAATAALAGRGLPARPRCPERRLETLRAGRGGGERTVRVAGTLPRGACLSYAVRVREEGRLLVCVPAGYTLEAEGFEPVRGGRCPEPEENRPPHRLHRSRPLAAGAEVAGITLTRRDDAPRDFTLHVTFQPRGPGRAED